LVALLSGVAGSMLRDKKVVSICAFSTTPLIIVLKTDL
jgi:hypothetical protein